MRDKTRFTAADAERERRGTDKSAHAMAFLLLNEARECLAVLCEREEKA
jgi:hypothetical protein